jgi:hypothetical protein
MENLWSANKMIVLLSKASRLWLSVPELLSFRAVDERNSLCYEWVYDFWLRTFFLIRVAGIR